MKQFYRLLALFALLSVVACATQPPREIQVTKPSTPVKPPSKAPKQPTIKPSAYAGTIKLCRTNISNAPRASTEGVIAKADQTVRISTIRLLMMPATKSCLSSGYGSRNGKLHKGVDYFSKNNGQVLAAANGVILEAVKRTDYGNMVLIDHGAGVYTRYAHLARFNENTRVGAKVQKGDVLGPIGGSGAAFATHLHYEILKGSYDNPKRSFGLSPVNPFTG